MSETDNIARGNHVVPTEWAQQLERERDEAVEEIKEWKTLCLWGGTPEHIHGFIRGQQSRIQHLERERDEAREELEDVKEYGTDEINAAVDLRQRLATALVERDEAREKYATEATEHMLSINRICNERDEARAVADELAAIATTPMGQDDDHLAQSRRISETLARWKSLASA